MEPLALQMLVIYNPWPLAMLPGVDESCCSVTSEGLKVPHACSAAIWPAIVWHDTTKYNAAYTHSNLS